MEDIKEALARHCWTQGIAKTDLDKISQTLAACGYTEASILSLGYLRPESDLTSIEEDGLEKNHWLSFNAPQRAAMRIINFKKIYFHLRRFTHVNYTFI